MVWETRSIILDEGSIMYAVDADLLRRRRLLSTFFVSVRLLLAVDMDYLAPHFLSAWRSYHRISSSYRISYFPAGFLAWVSHSLKCSHCAVQLHLFWLLWRNLVSRGTVFTRVIATGRYACSSELFDIRATNHSDFNLNICCSLFSFCCAIRGP